VVPGEDEIAALAEAALRVLDGEEQARDYAAFRKTSARGAGEQGT
jgi:butyrate kinase